MNHNYFKMNILSYSKNQAFIRDAVAAFCLELNPSLSALSDVKTAVSEAVTNCMVHAYRRNVGTITIECMIDNDTLHIKVTDFGCGIKDVDKALQPFYTTCRSEERSEWALRSCKRLWMTFPSNRLSARERSCIWQKNLKRKWKMLSHEQTLELIRSAKENDQQAKETLIVENTSLIKSIVKRYVGKGVEYDDLFQLASIGLIKAIYGFDESYDVHFSTYAVPLIAGEIKRFMRDDGAIKVSRAIKTTAKEIRKYIDEYTSAKGKQPSVDEIAQKFEMSQSEVVFTLGSNHMPISLQERGEYKDEQSQELIDRLLVCDKQEEMVERIELRTAIEQLPERERKIIILRYYRDMTQSEVADVMGVSQVQVSRIENKIIDRFKSVLELR